MIVDQVTLLTVTEDCIGLAGLLKCSFGDIFFSTIDRMPIGMISEGLEVRRRGKGKTSC